MRDVTSFYILHIWYFQSMEACILLLCGLNITCLLVSQHFMICLNYFILMLLFIKKIKSGVVGRLEEFSCAACDQEQPL